MIRSTLILIFICGFFHQELWAANAKIRLTKGSYANRTHIDTGHGSSIGRANLNFDYVGCDEFPDPNRLKLVPDPYCTKTTSRVMAVEGKEKYIESRTGKVTMIYEDEKECSPSDRYHRQFHVNYPLKKVWDSFNKDGKNCYPTHLEFTDGSGTPEGTLKKNVQEPAFCELPHTRVKTPGFLTEDYSFYNLSANEKGFKFGNHTEYYFDHYKKTWCVAYKGKGECKEAKDWPGPVPMIRKSPDGRFHVDGTVSLLPDGRAIIRAIDNKSFASRAEIFVAQRNGGLNQTNPSKGRIVFSTRQKKNGLVRSLLQSFDYDSPGAPQRRAVQFFPRNLFGMGVTNTWCEEDHCFTKIEKHKKVPEATYAKLAKSVCSENPDINMKNGGNGNVCRSCLGITPGHCATKLEDVKYMRSKLDTDKDFVIMNTGEYRPGQDIEKGLHKNFAKIVTGPTNPGCHKGYSNPYKGKLDGSEVVEGEAIRSGASEKDKSL